MKKLFAVALSTLSLNCFADIRLALDVGEGDVDFSNDLNFHEYSAGQDTFVMAGYVGYVAANRLIFDFGLGKQTDDTVFGFNDNVQFTTYEFLTGYLLEYKKLYLEPKLGFARWDFEIEEGEFLNPGDERKLDDHGYDPMLMITAGYRFVDLFGISVSYKYQDFAHGKATATTLGFDFAI